MPVLILGFGLCAEAEAQALTFDRLSAICRGTAAQRPTALAHRIAERAREEHRLFGGHSIDASGRIRRFGRMEAEAGPGGGPNGTPVANLPWRHVLRYWETLSGASAAEQEASGVQTVTVHPEALGAGPDGRVSRREVALETLLRAIRSAEWPGSGDGAERIREALRQSVIRASIADVPWSAAFISAVMKDAGVPGRRFAFSAGHIDYITQAVQTAARESAGEEARSLYRACNPYAVRPRAGDLVCYHRHGAAAQGRFPEPGRQLFRSLVGDIARGGSPISRTHCDVVTEVDLAAKKVKVIGGNVQQAVTEKTLKLTRANVLSPNQGSLRCLPSRDGPDTETPNCNLNAQAWFALLQVRD